MAREDILKRLGYTVPENRKKRVIVVTDLAAEADDYFALCHHLLTPSEEIAGVVAANFEWRYRTSNSPYMKKRRGTSMERSFQDARTFLSLLGMEDIPVWKGAADAFGENHEIPESEGADAIIREAMKKDEKPLYLAVQSTLTDVAAAYLKENKIAEGIAAVIFIGGGNYPEGGTESNLQQDVYAGQVVFSSDLPLWQIPLGTYAGMNISRAELALKLGSCGEPGKYLLAKMQSVLDFYGKVPLRLDFPHGEVWSLGDQPTVSVLLENEAGKRYRNVKAPEIQEDMTYLENSDGKEIRVYTSIDRRLTFDDFFAKMRLAYGVSGNTDISQ